MAPSSDLWQRADEIFDAALDLPPEEREALLERRCGPDRELRQLVGRLLAEADREDVSSLTPGGGLRGPVAESLVKSLETLADEPTRPLPPAPSSMKPAADEPDLSGRRIGHYVLKGVIARGGMSVIYRARDERQGRVAALKILPRRLLTDVRAKGRFLTEAQAIARLDHPNICALYECAEVDGMLFMAMACYEGETLAAKIRQGPLPVATAVDWARQLAEGLAHAHAAGIIHRDIKPSNLMITGDGVLKILDFGVAKLAEGGISTQTGIILGTVAYMSPEQIRGELLDARSDVWSLGTVLFEMLAARRAFAGATPPDVFEAILHGEAPAVRSLRPGVPPALDTILGRLLAKVRAERYATAAQVAEELAGVALRG